MRRETNFNAIWSQTWAVSEAFSTDDDYTRMPGWHTPQSLGKVLMTYFGVQPEELFAENLHYFVCEALVTMFLKTRDLLVGYAADPVAEWELHALPQLNVLHEWAVTVFLGTNTLASPGVTIEQFVWHPITAW